MQLPFLSCSDCPIHLIHLFLLFFVLILNSLSKESPNLIKLLKVRFTSSLFLSENVFKKSLYLIFLFCSNSNIFLAILDKKISSLFFNVYSQLPTLASFAVSRNNC